MAKVISIEDTTLEMLKELWESEQIPADRYVEELSRRGLYPNFGQSGNQALPGAWVFVPKEPSREWFERAFPAGAHVRNDPGAKRNYDAVIEFRMQEYRLLMKCAPMRDK
ncbi:hypothetical protein [Rhizobium sp. NPDC090279]|uniref:hypothetical protein n=1 Tax=Rhizobium sp. NPDC090279 TaxID=3364499 RepID=UPI00383AD18E